MYNYTSNNYRLVKGQDPRMLLPPIITNPISNIDYWKDNDLIIRSGINSQKMQNYTLSGYSSPDNIHYEALSRSENFLNNKLNDQLNNKNNVETSIKYNNINNNFEGPQKIKSKNTKLIPIYSKPITNIVTNDKLNSTNMNFDLPLKYKINSIYVEKLQPEVFVENIPNKINYNLGIEGSFIRGNIIQYQDLNTGQIFMKEILPNDVIKDKINPQYIELGEKYKNPPKYDDGKSLTKLSLPKELSYSTQPQDIPNHFNKVDRSYEHEYEFEAQHPKKYSEQELKERYYIPEKVNFFYQDDLPSCNTVLEEELNQVNEAPKNEFSIFHPINVIERSKTDNIKYCKNFTENTIKNRNDIMERLLRKRNSEMWQLRVAPIHGRTTGK